MHAVPADDELALALAGAQADPMQREPFLARLAVAPIRALLYRPPGEGAAAPWLNLVRWQRAVTGQACVPLFTHPDQFPHALPPPAVMVRVAMRELLSITPALPFVVNPMTTKGWDITAADHALMRDVLWAKGLACEQPSLTAPWAFRAALNETAPLARALTPWCDVHGIAQAYLYRLDRNDDSGEQMVLGLVHPANAVLRASAIACAQHAGWPVPLVRFLPDEPSHTAGVASMSLVPFYDRALPRR